MPLALGVNIQESKAASVDNFVGGFHRREFKRFLGIVAFARANAIAKGLINLKHVGEGVMASIFEFEQKGRASMDPVMSPNEQVPRLADSPILLAEHPQTGDREVRMAKGGARHGDEGLEASVESHDIYGA